MRKEYTNKVTLLIEIIPFISKEPCFALKGGTAINLFYTDMPRLSVDKIPNLSKGFLAMMLCHNKPVHELLNPNVKN